MPNPAGRPTLKDETLMANVINKSWLLIDRDLSNPKLSREKKRKIAVEIAKKTIPKKIEMSATYKIEAIEKLIGIADDKALERKQERWINDFQGILQKVKGVAHKKLTEKLREHIEKEVQRIIR